MRYEPAESSSSLFGGNSNWRGPIWFPLNYLFVEALEMYDHYYGDALTVEYPQGSGAQRTLKEIAADLSDRLCQIFYRADESGRRPVLGPHPLFAGEEWSDRLLFYEYFHGDDGSGVGASHQTGWTALVASLLQRYPRRAIKRD